MGKIKRHTVALGDAIAGLITARPAGIGRVKLRTP
jgi:hypothetical protein